MSLTYHKGINQLTCHYCGYTYQLPKACPACEGTELVNRGFGTEKIEDDIKILFPPKQPWRVWIWIPPAPLCLRKDYCSVKKNNIGYFFYIGGNDSMDTIKQLSEYAKAKNITDITFMGVPKTIDNDLAVTDHTPGYGSAAKYIASTMKEIIRDALVQPIKIVNIIEIMGRNAGWLTAASALAKGDDCEGVDLIYLPETVFDINKFVAKVQEIQKTKKQIVVAVSEGVKTADGKYVCESASSNMLVDSFGHKQLSGTASALANVISNEIGCKTRAIEFSTIQRCASHIASLTDVNEAFIVGGIAVKAAFDGETGKVGIFQRLSNKPYLMGTSIYDVNAIANVEKTVPQEWIINDGTGVSQEALDYMRPLIQGEIYPYMVDGLPRHTNFNLFRV